MSAQAYALNVAQREYIPASGKKLVNTYAQRTAIGTALMPKAKKFPGGTRWRETISFRPLAGGAHVKGDVFDYATDRGTEQPIFFDVKFLEVSVVFNKLDAWVFNAGPDAIYNLLNTKMTKAFETLGIMFDIACYLPGAAGTSWSKNINGLAEICNDGTNNAWTGAAYANYGDLSRANVDYGRAVQGKLSSAVGAITSRKLFDSYADVQYFGADAKVRGYTTPKFVTYIEDRWQTNQKFVNQNDPDIGFPGIKVHGSTLVPTRYCPGSYISASSATTGDPVAYEYTLRTTKGSDGGQLTAYPTVTGESLFWLTEGDDFLYAFRSSHPVMAMGFDDFVPDPDTDELVGRVRLACNLVAKDNRRQHELNGLTVS